MDQALWSSLPTELIELVVAKSPFVSVVRMRLVCKSWNNFILSEGFPCLNPNPKSLLVHSSPFGNDLGINEEVDSKRSITVYDTVRGGWQKLFINIPREVLNEPVERPVLVATGGGLLCYECKISANKAEPILIVHNPIRRKWKRLSSMDLQDPRLSSGTSVQWAVNGLVYDEICRNYKLVVAGFCLEDRNFDKDWFLKWTQVYDSATQSWTLTAQDTEIMGTWRDFILATNKSLFWNNYLYVVTSIEYSDGWENDVAIFSMKRGTWTSISHNHFTEYESPAYLVHHENQVLLVAEDSLETNTQTFGFWKLNIPDVEVMWGPNQPQTENLWLKLKSVKRDEPPVDVNDSQRFLTNWACVGHGNLASFTFSTFVDVRHHRTCRIMMHDLQKDSWRPLPNTECAQLGLFPCFFCSFEPSLSASV